MNWLAVILGILKLAFEIFRTVKEVNDDKKLARMEAEKEALEALQDRDASKLTFAFHKLKRLRS